ncbi:ROK family protein [Spiroplasma endosymbiont of Crioceris asparagi]|uniref:ROK family protein n=1 Tax=Spiroplasma endosymbiont of Crioceris asparagi TaxID=3066286 RepID=UPI0030CEEF35
MIRYTFDVGGLGIKFIKFEDNKEIANDKFEYSKRVDAFRVDLLDVLEIIKNTYQNETNDFEVGISIPGYVDTKNYRVLSESAITNINQDIFKIINHKNMKKLIIENDGKAATLGEYNFGLENKPETYIHMTIGSGLGGGIIINDKLIKGSQLKAAEFSKLFVNLNSNEITIAAQVAGLGANIVKYSRSKKLDKLISGIEFMNLVDSGDEIATRLFDEWTTTLAKLIINIDYVLDFDLLTLGGGISENKDFYKALVTKINQYENKLENPEVAKRIKISSLKNKAGCYGCLSILNK